LFTARWLVLNAVLGLAEGSTWHSTTAVWRGAAITAVFRRSREVIDTSDTRQLGPPSTELAPPAAQVAHRKSRGCSSKAGS